MPQPGQAPASLLQSLHLEPTALASTPRLPRFLPSPSCFLWELGCISQCGCQTLGLLPFENSCTWAAGLRSPSFLRPRVLPSLSGLLCQAPGRG